MLHRFGVITYLHQFLIEGTTCTLSSLWHFFTNIISIKSRALSRLRGKVDSGEVIYIKADTDLTAFIKE